MNLNIGINSVWIMIGLSIAVVLLLILQIVSMASMRKLKKNYKKFMKGSKGENLEATILKRFEEIDLLKEDIKQIKKQDKETAEVLSCAYQKIGIVKYDAFKEMGGKLSFSLCLLNDNNDGIILSSMHSSREGCYTYIKEIIKGESFVLLSQEEKQALEEAKNKTNYYE